IRERRKASPIGVPGPTRGTSSFSSLVSISIPSLPWCDYLSIPVTILEKLAPTGKRDCARIFPARAIHVAQHDQGEPAQAIRGNNRCAFAPRIFLFALWVSPG